MTTHTPGPWMHKATAGNHDFAVYPEATGRDVALVRNEADACLIAESPEMYELLAGVIEAITPLLDADPEGRHEALWSLHADISQLQDRVREQKEIDDRDYPAGYFD